MTYRFSDETEPSLPGIHFRDQKYAVCREKDGELLYSSLSSEEGLRSFMQTFEDDIVGVRSNTGYGEIERALSSYFEGEAAVKPQETSDYRATVFGEVEFMTLRGEETQVFDELYENARSKTVQEAT
ncbi:MAG: hypothetical protein H8Z69_03660 [Nanohaloarchaea archaeon]|nr:hypothetical protein [Candidatus Nanohaloarchaea archaeon]